MRNGPYQKSPRPDTHVTYLVPSEGPDYHVPVPRHASHQQAALHRLQLHQRAQVRHVSASPLTVAPPVTRPAPACTCLPSTCCPRPAPSCPPRPVGPDRGLAHQAVRPSRARRLPRHPIYLPLHKAAPARNHHQSPAPCPHPSRRRCRCLVSHARSLPGGAHLVPTLELHPPYAPLRLALFRPRPPIRLIPVPVRLRPVLPPATTPPYHHLRPHPQAANAPAAPPPPTIRVCRRPPHRPGRGLQPEQDEHPRPRTRPRAARAGPAHYGGERAARGPCAQGLHPRHRPAAAAACAVEAHADGRLRPRAAARQPPPDLPALIAPEALHHRRLRRPAGLRPAAGHAPNHGRRDPSALALFRPAAHQAPFRVAGPGPACW